MIEFDILLKYIDLFGFMGTHIDHAQDFDKNLIHFDTIIEIYRSNLGVWGPYIDKNIVLIDKISIELSFRSIVFNTFQKNYRIIIIESK